MQLYIIRHAQSYNNAITDQRERVCDPPLTELGRRQAETLALHLAGAPHPEQRLGRSAEETSAETVKGYGITRIFCSAMQRALETARPLGLAIGIAPEVWVDIHENGGIYLDLPGGGTKGYPGKSRDAIASEFPSFVVSPEVTGEGWWRSPGQETRQAFLARAKRVARRLEQMARDGEEEAPAIVTHGDLMDALLKELLGIPADGLHWIHHFNTAITRIDFGTGGALHVRYVNRIAHMPQELVS